MKSVPATHLKANLSALLGDVERGEVIEVTRHGKTIARIVPGDNNRRDDVRKAIEEMENLRASLPKTGITIEDILKMRHEGHRY